MSPDIPRPESPSAQYHNAGKYTPDQCDPDLASAKMAGELVAKLGTPSIISKKFAVRYGIFKSLNHTAENPTGYDSSLRLKLYEDIAAHSVNIDGRYFERVWAYLMKPKYVISGTPFGNNAFEDEKKSGLSRLIGWIRGEKSNDTNNTNNAAH